MKVQQRKPLSLVSLVICGVSVDASEATRNAFKCVLEAKKGEKATIFVDHEKMNVGNAFTEGALKLGLKTRLVPLKPESGVFRKKVPTQVAKVLKDQRPQVCINILRGNREETPFRVELIQMETEDPHVRLAHCPGVTIDMLTHGALALDDEEHREMQSFADKLIRRLHGAKEVRMTSPSGTDVSMSVSGRRFFTDTRIDPTLTKWLNLPTGEVIVAPVEHTLTGRVVCDLAVGGIGKLSTAVEIVADGGRIQEEFSADKWLLDGVKDSIGVDEWSNVVGEFAFGVNPKARLVEEFLEAEKVLGTVHVAFGNNVDMPGGTNCSKNHMDFLISEPSVRVRYEDGSESELLCNGVFGVKG